MNCVAKRYIDPVERFIYFEDCKLQMDAKLWGEEYNRHNPPKKVYHLRLQSNRLISKLEFNSIRLTSFKCPY